MPTEPDLQLVEECARALAKSWGWKYDRLQDDNSMPGIGTKRTVRESAQAVLSKAAELQGPVEQEEDRSTVTVTLPYDEARALADHPAMLRPDDPKLVWVQTVKSAVRKLQAALDSEQGEQER